MRVKVIKENVKNAIFLIIFLFLLISHIYAAENCVSQGCHDSFQKDKYIHGPVRGRNCHRCHGGDDHPYPLIKKKEEICSICHKAVISKKIIHPPVSENCLHCHNPHSSKHESLLLESKDKLCFNCHDNKPFNEKVKHTPVTESCINCHAPHDSDYKKLLNDEGSKLCYNCHEQKNTKKFIHPPVKDEDCLGCHNPHSSPNKSLLNGDGNNLCFICHETKNYTGKKIVHNPVKENCLNCHQPHESDDAKLLNEQNICIKCHGDMINKLKVVHPPVLDKDCMGCHTPHTSDANKLLLFPMPDICFNCHDNKPFAKKHIHSPVTEACTMCHKPHSSSNENLLVTKKDFLCRECHNDLINTFRRYKKLHPPVSNEQCTICHNVHSSDIEKILNNAPLILCAECHDIGNAKVAKSIHKPVENGKCADCHNVHGGNETKFLVAKYPIENYPPYTPQTYELCFKCHNKDIARDVKTVTATNFRNGDKNLHYVHVNKEKSRNCKFCHDPHMSSQEKLIKRDYRSFGAWNIPINFKKTDTGGGCTVGCHKPYYYDRLKPVKNN